MIFIDSNVPMYLVGATHPNKVLAQRALETWVAHDERLVTDVEVLQEILHRYVAIARREAILPAFEALTGIVDEIFPVERRDVERVKDIVLSTERLSARDALHLAIMARHGIRRIMSFDEGFDGVPGIIRLTDRALG
ncbi:MAG: type II toxin-antitoxin system VapC family toxin [Nitrospira sp.]|nr:type II toxin-antitoxin system VapC family toxin [Nitrospira sp.]MDE0486475.1 type II toxin-antitoxin system VapC family toxin [Nitrospira sp.]